MIDSAPPKQTAWYTRVLAGFAFGVLMALSLPPINAWFLAFVTPLPLIWVACTSTTRPIRAALLTGVGTIPFWLYTYTWVFTNASPAGYPFLVLYMGATVVLTVLAVRVAVRATGTVPFFIGAPIMWLTVEVLRGEFLMGGYPWYLTSHPLIEAILLPAPARIIGAYGVSALVVALCASLADVGGWFKRSRPVRSRRRAIFAGGAVVVAPVWIALALISNATRPPASAATVTFGVVQTSVPQSQKQFSTVEEQLEDLEAFITLTVELAEQRPDIIVWPETMLQALCFNKTGLAEIEAYLGRPEPFAQAALALQSRIGIPMLYGAIAREELTIEQDQLTAERTYNSVVLVTGGEIQDRYDKIGLTPFGEVMPLISRFDTLEQWLLDIGAQGMTFELDTGDRIDPIRVGDIAVAPPVCFEVTKPHLCRRLTHADGVRSASVLVNPTNDAWFGHHPGGRSHHLLVARWRSLELAIPMVRAANTGVSASIDANGKVLARGRDGRNPEATGEALVFDVVPAPLEGATLYARFGHLLDWAWVVLGVGLLLGSWVGLIAREPDPV